MMFLKKNIMKIASLNFRNYKYMCFFSLIISLIILVFFYEYFFMEENSVYAMKKTKLLSDELFFKDKYNYGKKFNYKSIYTLDLERYSSMKTRPTINLTSLNNNKLSSFIPFSNLDIVNYKSNFSTFNNNRVRDALPLVVKLHFSMNLEYLTNNIYFLDTEIIKLHLLPLLEKSEFYGDFCESFKSGFTGHPWLVIYDNISNKWLIGVCTHAEFFKICKTFKCGLESTTYLINDTDFHGVPLKQHVRTFIVFENVEINRKIADIVKNNNVSNDFFDKYDLNIMYKLLEMVNSNNFNYIAENGQIFIVNSNKGQLLKCCLNFETLLNK